MRIRAWQLDGDVASDAFDMLPVLARQCGLNLAVTIESVPPLPEHVLPELWVQTDSGRYDASYFLQFVDLHLASVDAEAHWIMLTNKPLTSGDLNFVFAATADNGRAVLASISDLGRSPDERRRRLPLLLAHEFGHAVGLPKPGRLVYDNRHGAGHHCHAHGCLMHSLNSVAELDSLYQSVLARNLLLCPLCERECTQASGE